MHAWRSYVSLRILGMDADHEVAQKARRWVRTLLVTLPNYLLTLDAASFVPCLLDRQWSTRQAWQAASRNTGPCLAPGQTFMRPPNVPIMKSHF